MADIYDDLASSPLSAIVLINFITISTVATGLIYSNSTYKLNSSYVLRALPHFSHLSALEALRLIGNHHVNAKTLLI